MNHCNKVICELKQANENQVSGIAHVSSILAIHIGIVLHYTEKDFPFICQPVMNHISLF